MPTVRPDVLTDFICQVFQAAGAGEGAARQVASSLVASNLAGHDSHGVIRVMQYLDRIAIGEMSPTAAPEITRETALITMIDGRRSFGHVAARFAIEVTIEKARQQGMAATGLYNCSHIGRVGEWVEIAANQGLIGLAFCNGGRPGGSVAPYGGARPWCGTNPIAVAVPVAGRPPVLVDFATSVVSEGKLRVARNRGVPIPEGWILNAAGQATTDPRDFYNGGVLLPAAGYKGYGLALLMELLGGALTGRGCTGLPGFVDGNGVLFIVLDVAAFRPAEEFLQEAAALCDQARATAPAPGFSEVLLPGEPEQRATAQRLVEGLDLDETTWGQLTTAAARLGITPPANLAV